MRLERVARMYYEQQLSQAEIAQTLGISRPLISRLLSEAREAGVVEVKIHSKLPTGLLTLEEAQSVFEIGGGGLVVDGSDDRSTNQALGERALGLIDELGGGRLGLGWGQVIGIMVADLEARPAVRGPIVSICPLVGNFGVPIRYYHSNENVRIMAQQTKSSPYFLHTPAFAETRSELDLIYQTAHYQAIRREWDRLDIALVNISNHPSTPDFASGARYGDRLIQHRAVGRMIAYYFNVAGQIIDSDQDFVIQIPVEPLRAAPKVIGICAANVGVRALIGALRTGVITHIVARESLVKQALAVAKNAISS